MKIKKNIPSFLLGHPVSHSTSPVFQNAAFKNSGIHSVYLAIDINPLVFDDTIKELKKMDIMGINITLPYKNDIIKYIDELNPDAKFINAVNTIKIIKGKWIGYNTDWYGFYKTLEENNIKNNHNVLIIGAGGATSGVIYGLKEYGIKEITLTNRTFSKTEILKQQYQLNLLDFQKLNKYINDFSMIINCTTLNFNELLSGFNEYSVYFDIKYYTKTEYIKNFIDGSSMLLHQGAKSFLIWTGQEAPIDIMKKALFEKKG